MLHIAVVEDDKAYQDKIVSYLHRYEEEVGDRFKLSLFSDGDEIAENYKGDYDLILMDIEMRFLNGIQAAERIRMQDEKVIIIFLTNTPQYALEGYRVSALDYVLKPINYFEFCERIKRAAPKGLVLQLAYSVVFFLFLIPTYNWKGIFFFLAMFGWLLLIGLDLWVFGKMPARKVAYFSLRAFVLGEFTASLEWQIYYYGLVAGICCRDLTPFPL